MAEELKLRIDKKPSYFNKEMAIGIMTGLVIPGGLLLSGMVALGGAVIGGLVGKARMENEYVNGKKVGDPSFWNKDTALGGLIGTFAGQLGAVATLVTAAAMSNPITGIAATGVILGGTAIGALTGGYLGGSSGKAGMAREYEKAQKERIVNQLSQNVSPEVGQAVAYSMEHNKDWAKNVLEEKLLSASQTKQI